MSIAILLDINCKFDYQQGIFEYKIKNDRCVNFNNYVKDDDTFFVYLKN